jgi:flavin reductase (DIM6/NTAB) family NADH-FMN oxidoreductase RutF
MTRSSKIEGEALRRAMRKWSSGVTVVAAEHAGDRYGTTVSSFTSAALEPPLIIISLQTESQTHTLISKAGGFAVTILSVDQQELSDRLADLQTETMVTGAPCLKGGLACLDCSVVQTIKAGTNTLFLAEVVAVCSEEPAQGKPLVYHNQRYHQLLE